MLHHNFTNKWITKNLCRKSIDDCNLTVIGNNALITILQARFLKLFPEFFGFPFGYKIYVKFLIGKSSNCIEKRWGQIYPESNRMFRIEPYVQESLCPVGSLVARFFPDDTSIVPSWSEELTFGNFQDSQLLEENAWASQQTNSLSTPVISWTFAIVWIIAWTIVCIHTWLLLYNFGCCSG